ncbi:MAG: Na/Pi cotransporter family protein [Bacteroidaceae bacterium]|nr:Na/Pi cotransporter family protein [Bacteroidaceae bacterium]MBR4302691.1 Na/Pi cotransporter family protein [Bacteroidaceae bacterium]
MAILQVFTLLGALGMFLYGMNLMSSGLQKASGDKLRGFLTAMTSNPFKGVMTGLGITSVIQSSSATTVMVVSFVNAGLLTLAQAIGVIMGANIGTTVTAWLVSWLGFKADISILAVPLMALAFLFSNSKKNQRQNIGELLVGFCLLFLGLSFMKESVPDLNETPQVLDFVKTWSSHGFGSVLIFLAFGTALTLVLQSSSATMAITLIMLSMGWIPFDMACAMVLGENIGTTITANIAASVGNTQAKRAAMSHTIFNLFGVVWALIFFKPFLMLVGRIIELFGLPNPAADGFAVGSATSAEGTAALYGLSMLHTLFNTINTCILIWFVKFIENAVVWIIKTPKSQEQEMFRLKYISAGPLATPELATEQAFNEIMHFAQISRNGLGYARQAIAESNGDKFEELRNKLVKYEEISDRIDYEIAAFLNAVSMGDISEATSFKIKAMYKIIGELESLGDSGEAISRILSRKNIHNKKFDAETMHKLDDMVNVVDEAYQVVLENLEAAHKGELADIANAYNAEDRINRLRSNLRDAEIENMEDGDKNYQTSVYYIDVVNELERMGDFLINISQELERAFVNKIHE